MPPKPVSHTAWQLHSLGVCCAAIVCEATREIERVRALWGMASRHVHIVGGGLAGLTLGVALRRSGVTVTVVEAGNYPRHRVCGEFLSGLERDRLAEAGIEDLFASAMSHDSSVWWDGGCRIGTFQLPDPALAISRHDLDHALAQRFRETGGELRCRERGVPLEGAEGWVMASGRRRGPARWLGLKAHYRELDLEAGLEMHVGRGGYAGLTTLPGGEVNVCALLPGDSAVGGARAQMLPRRLRGIGLERLADRLERADIDPGSVTGVSHFAFGAQGEPGTALTLGDAAAVVAPFTGNGMSMAIDGALIAASILERWASGDMSWADARRLTREAMRRRFARRLWWSRALHPFLLRPAGRAALGWFGRSRLLPFRWLVRRLR